ncbi:VPS9 domain-containing protein 1 isoform X1 [Loxodonta africana]|uniref:VPS9 domain-containing protein 1 isoform X1 n=1 Tax=Loxodonta africana TaxID=9785 RepID=UPI000C81340F|nr:VPS9 domain-containing protein 1 isoform X3 [Loxodonta africana]
MAAAAGDGAVKPLQSAMKLANGAIELDTGNRPREAYTEYLRSIHYISQVLLEEAEMTKEAGETVPLDTSKMLKLAEQCLERAQSTAAKLGKPCLKPAKPMTAAVPSPTSRHRRVYSDEGGKLSPFLPPEIFQKLQMVESQNSKKELTPLEEASLQNQKLKAAYEARMARLDPTQAVQKTSLTLSLQRQMMENLVIAKAREETAPFLPVLGVPRRHPEYSLGEEVGQQYGCWLSVRRAEVFFRGVLPPPHILLSAHVLLTSNRLSPPSEAFLGTAPSKWAPAPFPPTEPLCPLYPPGPRGCSVQVCKEEGQGGSSSNGSLTLCPAPEEDGGAPAATTGGSQQDWPKLWRAKLKRSPGDLSLVTSLVSHLLSLPDHPISQLLRKLQGTVYSALYPVVSRATLSTTPAPGYCSLPSDTEGPVAPGSRRLRASQSLHCVLCPPEPALRPQDGLPNRGADGSPKGPPSPLGDAMSRLRDKDSSFEDLEQFLATSERWGLSPGGQSESPNPGVKREPLLEQLKSTVKDIHNAIDRLLSLTLLAFEGLNTAAAKDRCLACMEEAFFSPLWAPLLALYRSVHRAREVALSRSMELYRNTAPTALGVPAKLLPQDAEAQGTGTYPYHAAVQELGLLVLESCPQKKLECIVRALRVICACAEDCCRAQEASVPPGAAAIGADDLLPILSFVVLRSGLPQLVSECAALEEFVHEGYLIGEEGYCLTSLQSALSYVELLPQGALGK